MIAHETSSEKIQRELSIINKIHLCRLKRNEPTESYANKLEAKVAKYVLPKNERLTTDEQQWALLLLPSANLSADTRNLVTVQLTAGAAMREGDPASSLIHVHTADVKAIAGAFDLKLHVTPVSIAMINMPTSKHS